MTAGPVGAGRVRAALPSATMPAHRMNRDEFFAKLATMDEDRLRKALWNLYWRGSAPMRERIEAQLDPDGHASRQRTEETVDAAAVLDEVGDFVALARSGAYLAGDRRVSPRERTRWRFTFKRLAADAQAALSTDDVGTAAAAMEQLIDLACETKGFDYFRSDDPMQAAGFVVSDAVALLWTRLRDHHGFAGFADRAAPQLVRWESEFGWTRRGTGRVAEQETSLAAVVGRMLPAQDAWIGFAERYLDALDAVADEQPGRSRRAWRDPSTERRQRTQALAEWHGSMLDRFLHSEADGLLDRLADHPALGGPELLYLQARLAHQRDDLDRARHLVQQALETLPGHRGFLDLADSIGAPLPPRAQEMARRRSR